MHPLLTPDRRYYRRWINLFPNLLLPGCTQFISGRRISGLIWFAIYVASQLCSLVLLLAPGSSYTLQSSHWMDGIAWIIRLALIIDGFRQPIPRIGFKGWASVFGCVLLIALFPALLIRQFLIHPFLIPTASMQPTLMGNTFNPSGHTVSGDHILLNKTAYWTHPPKRGDIVVFSTDGIDNPHVRKSTYYIKRIVGLPGENVSINSPDLMINGMPIKVPEIFRIISGKSNGYHGFIPAESETLSDTITLASNEYYVLGDNTLNSLDSRHFGPITADSIIGKAVYIYAPGERKGKIE